MRMPDHHLQVIELGELTRQLVESSDAALHEGRSQQQVLGRVPCQREFGRDEETGPGRVRFTRSVDDALGIARQVADRRIDLRERDLDRGWR